LPHETIAQAWLRRLPGKQLSQTWLRLAFHYGLYELAPQLLICLVVYWSLPLLLRRAVRTVVEADANVVGT
jgi:hypothetical protein